MFNKDIYELLEYGKLLKNELKQLSLDLDNDYLCRNTFKINESISDIQEEIILLNKYIKFIDNFIPEDFVKFITKYLNQIDNKYVYSKVLVFDHNNYGASNHYFISDEITANYLSNNINCEYDLNHVKKVGLLDDVIHIQDSKFSIIDSNYDINQELSKYDELLLPIYGILQMKIDNPSIHNEDRLNNTLLNNKKELIKH